MGSIETIVVSSVGAGVVCTRFPVVISARPMRPEIGARTTVHSRLSRAVRTAASADRIAASPSARPLVRESSSSREIACVLTSRCARSSSMSASCFRVRARSSSASALATSASNGRGSMTNSTSPCFTSAPSAKATRCTKPPTRGRTSTAFTASKWPVNSSSSATSRVTAGATVTCGGGGVGCAWRQAVSRTPMPATSAAVYTSNARRRNRVGLMRHDS